MCIQMKIIHKYNLFHNVDFIAFHKNKKKYLVTLHKQMKKEMHRRMHNNDFDIVLRSVTIRPNYKSQNQ